MVQSRKKYYLALTGCVIVLFFFCFFIYVLLNHVSIMRYEDAYNQQYMIFAYVGKWIRSLATNIFVKHRFSVPAWAPSIGYGADAVVSWNTYFSDPFVWMFGLIPTRWTEAGFVALIFLKLLASGVAFSELCFSRSHKPYTTLCGALIYVFSGCAYVGVYQTFFINPMYIFPLVILGADRLFDRKKPGLYVVMLAFSAVNSFYFTYMMCVFLPFYCLFKWFSLDNARRTARRFWRIVGRFVGYSVLAAGMACVVLIPIGIAMLGMGRLDLTHYLPMLFDSNFNMGVYQGFITIFDMLGRDCKIGFSTLALISAFILFVLPRKHLRVKIEFVLLSFALIIPYFGHIMNGFSYTANRWVWVYALVVGYMVVVALEELESLSLRRYLFVLVLVVAYIGFGLYYFRRSNPVFLNMCAVLMLLAIHLPRMTRLPARYYQTAIVTVTCISIAIPAYYYYSPLYYNQFSWNIKPGVAYTNAVSFGGLPLLNEVNTADGTRYDRYGLDTVRNAALLYPASGIDMYCSLYNDNIDKFHNSMALRTSPYTFSYCGLDKRSELLSITGVNHFFVPVVNPYKPVGFDTLEAEMTVLDTQEEAWTSSKGNQLFYLFDKSISQEDYEKLTPIERQQAIMKACVLDKSEANASPVDLNIVPGTLDWSYAGFDESVSVVENSGCDIDIYNSNTGFSLSFEPVSNAEIYVYLHNIEFDDGGSVDYNVFVNGYNGENEVKGIKNSYYGTTYYFHMHGGKKNWMLNLGMSEEPVDRVYIRFNRPGHYHVDDIQVCFRSCDDVLANISALDRSPDNIQLDDNTFSCDVETTTDKLLFASIPYSKGWRAYDNGKPIDIQLCDVAFMAIKLDPGAHHIVFKYHTPGMSAGLLISVLSITGFIVILNLKKRKRKAQ